MWVFGQGGPQAFIKAATVKPALIEELQSRFPPRALDGEEWIFFGVELARDLPYGWATLVENALGVSFLERFIAWHQHLVAVLLPRNLWLVCSR